MAILSKSQSNVVKIINRDPHAVSYQNRAGQAPLHLAANWPWGVRFLLKAGASVSTVDKAGLLPLSYACFFTCSESVEIFLSAGSPLSSSTRAYTVLDDACTMRDFASFRSLVTALVQRREDLFQTARTIFPGQIPQDVTNPCNEILDSEAFHVINMLLDTGAHVDPHYWCFKNCSIYHSRNLFPDFAEMVYDLGFKDIESLDRNGLTPLQSIINAGRSQMKLAPWLISKGADIEQKLHTSAPFQHDLTTIHLVAASVGFSIKRTFFQETPPILGNVFDKTNLEMTNIVLNTDCNDWYDQCKCLCRRGIGCDAFVTLLKHVSSDRLSMGRYGTQYRRRDRSHRLTTMDWLLGIGTLGSDIKRKACLEALRLLLFDEMDLTHTCCRPDAEAGIRPPMDVDCAFQVVDEEIEAIAHFEASYDLAVAQWETSSLPFSRFFRLFIRESVSRSRCRQNLDVKYIQAVRDLGIQISEAFSDEEDSSAQSCSDEDDPVPGFVCGEVTSEEPIGAGYLHDADTVNEGLISKDEHARQDVIASNGDHEGVVIGTNSQSSVKQSIAEPSITRFGNVSSHDAQPNSTKKRKRANS